MNKYQDSFLKDCIKFAEKDLKPFAASFDEKGVLKKSLIQKLSKKGYLGATFPESLGGLELDQVNYGLLTEELGKACNNTRSLLTVQVSLVGESIIKWGSKEQINRWIPEMIKGSKIAAFALTEPNHGSDAHSIETIYIKDGNNFILNGYKKWISFAAIADIFLVFARNNESITAFIVDKEMQGVSIRPMTGLLGSRASHVAEIELNNVRVPTENVIGEIGSGFKDVATFALDNGRYSVAWAGVSLSQAALEAMVSYSRNRSQFGEKLRSFQMIKQLIGDGVTNTHAARALCLKAGKSRDQKDSNAQIETSIAKYFCSKVATEVTSNALQVHGGNGCYNKFPVERYFRDAKILEIIEGTSQIQAQIIASYGIQNYFIRNYPSN